jgi:alpha-tubulin suppressor-like RCC1 family protein
MLAIKHAGFVVMAGAVTLSGCDFERLADILRKKGNGHHGHGHGHGHPPKPCAEECPDTHFPSSDDPEDCLLQATSVSAGVGYTCATLANGALKCWGGDSWYRLGYGAPEVTRGDAPGEMGNALPAIPLGAGLSATEVFADSDLTCAILDSGNVKCWGYNGYGAVTGIPNPPSVAGTVDTLPERTFAGRSAIQVAAGSGTGYVLLDDGTLNSITTSVFNNPLGTGRVGVQFGRSTLYDHWHMCTVLDDGGVVCSGAGSAGQLGRNPVGDLFPAPPEGYPLVDLGTGRTATQVALGDAHTCALLDGGDVKCWGLNTYGQLGLGDTNNRGLLPAELGDALPVVPLGQPAQAITAGRNYACALLEDGSVKCWGRNDSGQLGLGHTNDIGDAPGEVAALTGVDLGTGRTATAIDGGSHTCAILDTGALKCWGENGSGQLGLGDTADRGVAPGQLGDALPEIDLGS